VTTDDPELDQLTPARRRSCATSPGASPTRRRPSGCTISVKTVETHVSSVLRKLQLSNRHELTAWAADRRLI
jgi:hypothetical protein